VLREALQRRFDTAIDGHKVTLLVAPAGSGCGPARADSR